jgi:hypothetical protein
LCFHARLRRTAIRPALQSALRLKGLLGGGSPASVPRQGFADKSLRSGPIFFKVGQIRQAVVFAVIFSGSTEAFPRILFVVCNPCAWDFGRTNRDLHTSAEKI